MMHEAGWPADRGPLKTLHEAGLIPYPAFRPRWLHYPKIQHSNGKEVYRASTKFMNKDGLRALAALTLEGWEVHVNPMADELDIKITRSPEL